MVYKCICMYMYALLLYCIQGKAHIHSQCSRFFTKWCQLTFSKSCMFHILPWMCIFSWLHSLLPCVRPLNTISPQPLLHLLGCFIFSVLHGAFFLWKLGQLLFLQSTHCALHEVTYLYLQFLHYLFIIKYVDMCCCSGWNKKHSLFILYTQTHYQHSIQYTFLLFNFSISLILIQTGKCLTIHGVLWRHTFSCLCYNGELSTSKDRERFHRGARKTTFAAIEIESKWFKDSHIGPLNWIEKPPWLSKELGASCLVLASWPHTLLKTHPQEWLLSEGENTIFFWHF